MPKREIARRKTAPTSGRRYTLAEMNRQVAVTSTCTAIYLLDSEGHPAMVLMSDACPTCRAFREQIPRRPVVGPPPAAITDTDDLVG
jgi:hypothetical protein